MPLTKPTLIGQSLGHLVEMLAKKTMPVSRPTDIANQQHWARLTALRAPLRQKVTLSRKVQEANETTSLYLEADQLKVFGFRAGQFVTCRFVVNGELVSRAYSLSSAPHDAELRITVKALPDGMVSCYIRDHLQVGDSFEIQGPSGEFVLSDQVAADTPLLMLAAGSGITPILSIVRDQLHRHPQRPIQLLFGNRAKADIIFHKTLQALATAHANLQVKFWLSQPEKSWKGARGRIDADAVVSAMGDLSATGPAVFVCGPDAFIESMRAALTPFKLPARQLHIERFLPAARAQTLHPDTPQVMHFAHNQQAVAVAAGQSLLEAGLAAGISMPYSCQMGGCGHCKVKLVSGELVTDEPNCLSEAEAAQGYRLACLSYACSPVTIALPGLS